MLHFRQEVNEWLARIQVGDLVASWSQDGRGTEDILRRTWDGMRPGLHQIEVR